MTLEQMNNSKTAFHEAKTSEIIAGTGNTEQVSLIKEFSELSRHTKER